MTLRSSILTLFLSSLALLQATSTLTAQAPTATGGTQVAPVISAARYAARSNDRYWVSADYLMWWQRGSSTPPLVTASAPGTPFSDAGVVGLPTTQTVFGDETLNGGPRSGFRLDAGLWLGDAQQWGVDFGFLTLEDKSDEFADSSDGSRILARPFVDANTGQAISELVSYPGTIQGGVDVVATSQGLTGWNTGLRYRLMDCGDRCSQERVDLLIGYRRLRLDDGLRIHEELTSPIFPAGTVLSLTDQFDTQNRFDGVELGLIDTLQRGCWKLTALGKVALGQTSSRIRVDGTTTIISPNFPTVTNPGGLYALSSNMGEVEIDQFSAVFELGFAAGYRIAPSLWVNFGYTFLLWPNVFRAGEQVDTTINPNLLPPVNPPVAGPLRPALQPNDQTFWAQGLHLGLEYRF